MSQPDVEPAADAGLNDDDFRSIRATILFDPSADDIDIALSPLIHGGSDRQKAAVLADLDELIEGATTALLDSPAAADSFTSGVAHGRAGEARHRLSRAFDLAQAIRRSLGQPSDRHDESFEIHVRRRRDELDHQRRRAHDFHRLGGEPGRGLPFFELYMKRRNKKSWGNAHNGHC